jgi:hypothetical protein
MRTREPVPLRVENGVLAVQVEAIYPEFYISGEDVRANGYSSQYAAASDRWPAIMMHGGLAWDPDWVVFAAFYDDDKAGEIPAPDIRIQNAMSKGELDWELCCPVLEGPSTLIGQLIRQYGSFTGGNPSKLGHNPTQSMLRYPLSGMLQAIPDTQLHKFRDRTDTLLDLAMTHQQWDFAEWLWDKGVRWSDEALAVLRPLESIVVGSATLQESLGTGFLSGRGPQARADWLGAWLERWKSQGVEYSNVPHSTRRAEMAVANGWQDGKSLLDTPASLWASSFAWREGPAMMPLANAPAQVQPMLEQWVRFWEEQDVDLAALPIAQASGHACGMKEYWAKTRNSGPWIDHVLALSEQMRLDLRTDRSLTSSRGGPRL